MAHEDERADAAGPLDHLVSELQRRRAEAGSPSYAELAARVESGRRERGVGDFESKVSRSTIYDLFRLGRRRIDVELFLEVLAALGASPEELAGWRTTATRALSGAAPAPTAAARMPVASAVELPQLTPSGARLRPLSRRAALLVLLGAVLINMLGNQLVNVLPIDLYLDMIGTAIAAVIVGPWPAAGVGVITDVWEVHTGGAWQGLWFALSNAAGALLWGYGVRRGFGRTILRFLALTIVVAFCVTVVSTVILLFAFDGYTGHATDSLARSLVDRGHSLVVSVFSTNLLTSLEDKLLAGFIALIAAESLAVRQSGQSTRLPLGD